MRFGILGGGFGLYGWLPAVLSFRGCAVTTLERYRDTIRRRPELVHFEPRLSFVQRFEDLLDGCDVLLVARRPVDQVLTVDKALYAGWRGALILEKPLAPDPLAALALLGRLEKADVPMTIGFSLCETAWSRDLARCVQTFAPERLDVTWRFLANHYRQGIDTWKRRTSEGGGALRFFAIHLVALLSKLGPCQVIECSPLDGSSGEDPACSFSVKVGATQIRMACDSDWSQPSEFTLSATVGRSTLLQAALPDPFSQTGALTTEVAGQDKRVPQLASIVAAALAGSWGKPRDYLSHVRLWQDLEVNRGHGHRSFGFPEIGFVRDKGDTSRRME